jgi:hypothetical protein
MVSSKLQLHTILTPNQDILAITLVLSDRASRWQLQKKRESNGILRLTRVYIIYIQLDSEH